MLLDEAHRLQKLILGKIANAVRQVELHDQPPGNRISVRHGPPAADGKALKRVSCGVPQVQRLTDIFFVRSFSTIPRLMPTERKTSSFSWL